MRRRACAVLAASNKADAAISLLLTTDGPMQELNRQWRDEDRPTDVLSFPATVAEGAGPSLALPPGIPEFLGDIVLDLDAIGRQATEQLPQRLARLGLQTAEGAGWGVLEEATFLLVHGILHLLGHDHHEPQAEAAMVAEEARLMAPFLRAPWHKAR